MRSQVTFRLPPELEAPAPPEARGLRRDRVRMLVVERGTGAISHRRFDELPQVLAPGDLLVVNDSRTLPASLLGRTPGGQPVEVRLVGGPERPAEPAGERWAALPLGVPVGVPDPALVPTDARPPAPPLAPGTVLRFGPPGGRAGAGGPLTATVLGPHDQAPRLVWLAFDRSGPALLDALLRSGRPVRYAYVPRPWPLHHYQTVFAAVGGSAEMPSAGRPFTVEALQALRRRGVRLAAVRLHAGLSTYGDPEVDRSFIPAEPYMVPEATAEAVARARAAGGRVVAVGTTVVRALETAGAGGRVAAGSGWTRLRIQPGTRLAVVDGLLTGLHEPEASHLDLLGAFLSPEELRAAYDEALARGYLWHEFGDVSLILPPRVG